MASVDAGRWIEARGTDRKKRLEKGERKQTGGLSIQEKKTELGSFVATSLTCVFIAQTLLLTSHSSHQHSPVLIVLKYSTGVYGTTTKKDLFLCCSFYCSVWMKIDFFVKIFF